MRKIVGIGLLLALAGCPRRELSELMTEAATVDDVVTAPAQHGSTSGFTIKGDYTFGSVNVPEHYAVVFTCQHGRFMLQGDSGDKVYAVWKKATKGAHVTVTYREKWDVFKDGTRQRVGYEFVDIANAREPQ